MQTCSLLQTLVTLNGGAQAYNSSFVQYQFKAKVTSDASDGSKDAVVTEESDEFDRDDTIDQKIHAIVQNPDSEEAIRMLGWMIRMTIANEYDYYEAEMGIAEALDRFCPHVLQKLGENFKFKITTNIMLAFKQVLLMLPCFAHFFFQTCFQPDKLNFSNTIFFC